MRFHKPNKFGDNLTKIRASVKYVNEIHKPIIGFEEGKIFNGYRFVYPLTDANNNHIGSVEISSSLLSFKKIFEENNNEHIDFILFKDTVEKKVFKKQLKNYKEYTPFKNFYIQSTLAKYNSENCKHHKSMKKFLHLIDENALLKKHQKNLFYTKFIDGKLYTMNFIPLYNDFNGDLVGYSIVYANSKYLDYFSISIILSFISVLLFSIITGFLVSLFNNIKTKKEGIKLLLNNANDGFISFNMNTYQILIGSSLKSQELLGMDTLTDRNIASVLFRNSIRDKETFIKGIETIVQIKEDDAIELIISLLPTEAIILNHTIHIEYKIIGNGKMMLILQDITEQNQLKEKYEQETLQQKMVVTAAKQKDMFLEVCDDFKLFLTHHYFLDISHSLEQNLNTLLQKLHTFKGVFHQYYFVLTPHAIHELETELHTFQDKTKKYTNEDVNKFLIKYDLERYYEKDIQFIYSILGRSYFEKPEEICFTLETYKEIEKRIVSLSNGNVNEKQRDIAFLKNAIENSHEKISTHF